MRLYEIADMYRRFIDEGFAVDYDTGEVMEDTGALDAIECLLEDKVEACACVYKEYMADADAIAAERKRLAARERATRNRAERLRAYIQSCMESCDVRKVETSKARVSTRRSRSVEVTDADRLPPTYMRVKAEPDKTAIRKALAGGGEVPGARMVEKTSVSVG